MSLQNGTYAFKEFGTEIYVTNNQATSAKVFEDTIMLTQSMDSFNGKSTKPVKVTSIKKNEDEESPVSEKEPATKDEITCSDDAAVPKNSITTSVTVKKKNKKSLLTEVTQTTSLIKSPKDKIYSFSEGDITLAIKKDRIIELYTGANSQTLFSILTLNQDGTIATYNITNKSTSPYVLKAEGNEITHFWCNECAYEIYGTSESAINISGNSLVSFASNQILMTNISSGIRKTITTQDAKQIDIDVLYFDDHNMLEASEQFIVGKESVTHKNTARFLTKRIAPKLL